MTRQTLKTRTRIELRGTPELGVPPEAATIGRWRKVNDDGTGINCIRGNGGWHVVRFDDGGSLMVHETNFRVTDNRAGA